nr:uncharacterized mitochondrial protein AtMg00810-like [Tanacetum cinerariifolium]
APRAWYDELSTFLLQNHFIKGTIDPTLFIKRFHDDILVVQAKPTEKHHKEVKRIFRYLRGTVNIGLWCTKDSGFELTGFLDADYAGCKDTFKSTSGGAQFLGEKLTEMELELEQTQQGSSHEVSVSTKGVEELKRIVRLKGVKKEALHTTLDDGVTTSFQLSQNSRPSMLIHQDKYMIKAQVHVSKSSAISDVQPLPRRKHYCQIYQMVKHMLRGRLLASFQDLKHKGGDIRLQGGIKDNDSKIKIQDHWRANDHSNEFPRTRL